MEPTNDDRTEADKLYQLAAKLVDTVFTRDKMPIYEEMQRLIAVAKERDAAWLAEIEAQRSKRK
jgi:hypothetical protein